jgi:hypothetical protein
MTKNTQEFKNVPLAWNPSLIDNSPTFNGYQSFGGWLLPTIKFYVRKIICGINSTALYYEP